MLPWVAEATDALFAGHPSLRVRTQGWHHAFLLKNGEVHLDLWKKPRDRVTLEESLGLAQMLPPDTYLVVTHSSDLAPELMWFGRVSIAEYSKFDKRLRRRAR